MRTRAEYDAALRLNSSGSTDGTVARALGIPRETVRDWRRAASAGKSHGTKQGSACPVCSTSVLFDKLAYAYLLGMYLGDGWLPEHPRGVFKLRVSLDARQPAIVEECSRAIAGVAPGKRVGRQAGRGCVILGAYWKHWRCLFPQHGPGRKHSRSIELARWQLEIAQAFPERLLRGLIHADGCRVANRVGRRVYPRYLFSNRSRDILRIFCRACEAFGVSWTQPSIKHISVARAHDVARLDAIIGPKH
jgi:hypothetical protein